VGSRGWKKDAEGAASIMHLRSSLVHAAFNSITWVCLAARRPALASDPLEGLIGTR
jgi:hypothetical protein